MTGQPWTPPTAHPPPDTSSWRGQESQWGEPREPEPQWGPPAATAPSSRRRKIIGAVLIPAAIGLLLGISRVLNAPPPLIEVDTRMAIAAPFVIGQSDALLEQQMRQSIEGQPDAAAIRDMGVRTIVRDGETIGYLVIVDVALRGNDSRFVAEFEAGASGEGGTAERRTMDGRTISVITLPDGVLAMWTSAPLAYMVIAFDPESAELLIDAVIDAALAAPRAP